MIANIRCNSPHSPAMTLFVIACIIILAGIGFRDAWPPDEPRFVLVAKEMVESGQWLIPMRGGEIYPDKPPIFMWSIALVYWLTGSLKVAMLLPNAIASIITLALTYKLSQKLSGEPTATLSMLVLLLCPQFLIQAKFAQIDAMVACFIWTAVYGFIQHYYVKPNWRWYFVAWVFMGLGIITKGVGFLPILLLLPIFYFTLYKTRLNACWKKRALLGPLIMLAVIGLWLAPLLYLGLYQQEPDIQRYLSNILFKQTAQRYANAWHHIEPWYYYLVEVIPVFWIAAIAVLVSRAKYVKSALVAHPAYASLFIWVILVVVFFSISPGKRGVYVLPALPALAMIAGLVLAKYGTPSLLAYAARGITLVLSLVILAVGIILLFHEPTATKLISRYHSSSETLFNLSRMCLFLGISGLLTHLFYVRASSKTNQAKPTLTNSQSPALAYQLVSWVALMGIIPTTFGSGILNDVRTPKRILDNAAIEIAKHSNGTKANVAIVSFKEQYLLFAPFDVKHFGYHTPKNQENGTAWAWLTGALEKQHHTTSTELPQLSVRFILAPKEYIFECVDLTQAIALGVAHRDEWLLIPSTAANKSCPLPVDGPVYPNENDQ